MANLDYKGPDDRVGGSAEHRNRTLGIERIAEALIASGHTSLDAQAKALGIHRSTAWTIMKAKHKLGRLSAKTSRRMLANPQLPEQVRTVIQQYVTERTPSSGRTSRTIRGLKRRHFIAKRGQAQID